MKAYIESMKTGSWLIFGTLIGAIIGWLATLIFQHGWDSEAFYPLRIVWGALIGLGIGLAIDLFVGGRRR